MKRAMKKHALMLGGGATPFVAFLSGPGKPSQGRNQMLFSALPQYVNAPSDNPLSIVEWRWAGCCLGSDTVGE